MFSDTLASYFKLVWDVGEGKRTLWAGVKAQRWGVRVREVDFGGVGREEPVLVWLVVYGVAVGR